MGSTAKAAAKPAAQAPAQGQGSVREGSRWIGAVPDPSDVAAWFAENANIDTDLDAAKYLPGVTLISSQEKVKRLVNGQIQNVERLVHVPYAKVETRIAYFWDLCAAKGWHGVIEPVSVPRVNAPNFNNEHLPPGFFRVPVQEDAGKFVHFVACTMKVTIFEPDVRAGGRGKIIRDSPPATKMIAMIDRWNAADPFSLMKAETGAVGRALGMAGILALPGSGVATAEDMIEALAGARGAAVEGDSGTAPEVAGPPQTAEDRIAQLMTQVGEEKPGQADAIKEWAEGRGINLDDIKPTQQRAVIATLERALAS